MNIIMATRDQVQVLWNKLPPQERFFAPGDDGIYLPLFKTLVFVKEETALGSIAELKDEITPVKLRAMITDKSFLKVGY